MSDLAPRTLGTYVDGRSLSLLGEQYDVGGSPVSLADVLAYDASGQIAWASPDLKAWALSLSAPTVIDKRGAWCPHCGNRDSVKKIKGLGIIFWVFALVSMGLALLALPFLPREWRCHVCKNRWRA